LPRSGRDDRRHFSIDFRGGILIKVGMPAATVLIRISPSSC
jgi:hypothetical protein